MLLLQAANMPSGVQFLQISIPKHVSLLVFNNADKQQFDNFVC